MNLRWVENLELS